MIFIFFNLFFNFQILSQVPKKIEINLNKKISFKLKNATLENVLNHLNREITTPISFNNDLVEKSKLHSFNYSSIKIKDLLIDILNIYNAELKLINDNLILKYPLENKRKITGFIRDKKTNELLENVNVYIDKKAIGSSTDKQGIFKFDTMGQDSYNLKISSIGYKTIYIYNVDCFWEDLVNLEIYLEEDAYLLNEVIITPGKFSIIDSYNLPSYSLTQKDIQSFNFGDDVLRGMTKLPGIFSNEYGAKFSVRGGDYNEIQVIFDGIELKDPFHLKEFNGGAFSFLDVTIIDKVDLYTGVFPVNYGNKLSGIIDIKSIDPPENKTILNLGLSLLNMKFSILSNPLKKIDYMFLYRRGYFDLIRPFLVEEEIPDMKYNDLFGKVNYKFNEKNKLTLELLNGSDDLIYKNKIDDKVKTNYNNYHLWLISTNEIENFKSKTRFLFGKSSYSRKVSTIGDKIKRMSININENNEYNYWTFNQDFNINYKNYLINTGYEFSNSKTDLTYKNYGDLFKDSLGYNRLIEIKDDKKLNLINNRFSAYLSIKNTLWNKIFYEAGIRYDYYSYFNKFNFSPRISLAYFFEKSSSLAFSMGKHYQNQEVYEINIKEGESNIQEPKNALVTALSYENKITKSITMRLEAYIKKYYNGWETFIGMSDMIDLTPELKQDRFFISKTNGVSKGIELFLNYNSKELNISTSYSYSDHKSQLENIKYLYNEWEKNNLEIVSVYSIPHNFIINFSYFPFENFNVDMNWNYRSGKPITELDNEIVINDNKILLFYRPGKINNIRLPDFHRLDVRFNYTVKSFAGKFTFAFEIMNLYNKKNIRDYEYSYTYNGYTNKLIVNRKANYWLPLIPSFGINWSKEL